MIGVGVMARSAVGLAMVALLFLPTQICRARLEERALQEVFGPTWREHAARTGFMLPRLRRT
jgi:protein-S-isoprenylcysteine O-methyltransferase Ste14